MAAYHTHAMYRESTVDAMLYSERRLHSRKQNLTISAMPKMSDEMSPQINAFEKLSAVDTF